jgi:hypothetical protein
MNNLTKKAVIWSFALVLLQFLVMGVGLSPSAAAEEKNPDIKMKGISFLVREFPSTPYPVKMLEIRVEILNRSEQATAPPNSIKLVLVPKETKYPEGTPRTEFDPSPQETTISVPLPPVSALILTFGFSLPEKIPESMTFEIQINPPEGDKKTMTWEAPGIK